MGAKTVAGGVAAVVLSLAATTLATAGPGFAERPLAGGAAAGAPAPARLAASSTSDPSTWTTRTLRSPRRVQVLDASGVLATFTVGARTVTLRGATRVLSEPSTTQATVTTSTWVRLLDQPFTGNPDQAWLVARFADTSPDVLATAMQYVTGAPTLTHPSGELVAADASYGPLLADGTRQEGADFNDFLQQTWTYGPERDDPETDQAGALDCSGFVRMVMGYRLGIPLTLAPDGVRLPRRAAQMEASAPGVVTVAHSGGTPSAKALAALAPGDLVFFDGSTDDGTAIDHVGLYLGRDSAGAPRFVSSRKTVDGPTMGDVGGRSLLTGGGLYAASWRSARRL